MSSMPRREGFFRLVSHTPCFAPVPSWFDADSAFGRFVENLGGIFLQATREITKLTRRLTRLAHQALDLEQSLLGKVTELDFAFLGEAIDARRRLCKILCRNGHALQRRFDFRPR